MSGASPHPAPSAAAPARTPLAHLLHALNQPLTGLQCSLEVALVVDRPVEQYVRTLREGLALTARMRILVESIRELADEPPIPAPDPEPFPLGSVLSGVLDDLHPVAETRRIRFLLTVNDPCPVRGNQRRLGQLMFRFLESALALAADDATMKMAVTAQAGVACVMVTWRPGAVPEFSPFSRPELGLAIARAGWEQAGAQWMLEAGTSLVNCTIRLPLASRALPTWLAQQVERGETP